MAVRVVTDSTSDLPPDVARSLRVTVVPCYVTFGTEDLKDGVDLSADQFYERLVNGPDFPKTSQPSVGDFKQVYEEVGPGSDGIVSVHVSSKVSGTYNSATQAIPEATVECPIEVIDTYQASLAVGLVVRETAKVAQEGGDFETVARVARETAARSELVFVLDTLEYLEKGGRVGKAAALLGGLLRIRPLIIFRDGEVDQLAKARSRRAGIVRLLDAAREFAPLDEVGVVHTTTPDDADALAAQLKDLVPGGGEPLLSRAGPTIGTYAGPGALGIALIRSE